MGIDRFLKQKHSRAERFEGMSEDMSNEEQRELEQSLLKPTKLSKPLCPPPPASAKKPLSARTVKFVFPDTTTIERFKKHFNLSKYVEPSCIDNGIILALLDALDEGTLIYDKETQTLVQGKGMRKSLRPSRRKQGNPKRSAKVGRRKRRK